ncbi:hypothetical protein BDN67DRAFT_985692 [Paxillus ammoniavirescens]|nr:hypothetical protein BDN67DRAFT_985692 [Paxillus ammoniavirescens]
MYKCTIDSASQVLHLINYTTASISETEECDQSEGRSLVDEDTKIHFIEHFSHYLNGKGYPIHKLFNNTMVIPTDTRVFGFASSKVFPDITNMWFQRMHQWGGNCACRVLVPINKYVISLLTEPLPLDNSVSTLFDVWIHQSLFKVTVSGEFSLP